MYVNKYHYTLKPALKSIKLKHSSTGCFVNRLVRGFCTDESIDPDKSIDKTACRGVF